MKSKVFIHPGIGKTATSAIQFQAKNNISLSSATVYCPYGLLGDVHNKLADLHPLFEDSDFKYEIAKFRQLDKSKNYLISSEFLAYSSFENISELVDSINKADFDVHVIFAIRELDQLILSSYLQSLKTTFGLKKGESIVDYAQRTKNNFNFLKLIEKWEKAGVTSDNISILNFDQNKKKFVSSFFKYLDITLAGSAKTNTKVNESLICELIPMIRQYDNDFPSCEENIRKRFIENALLLSEKFKGLSQKDFHLQCVSNVTMNMGRNQLRKLRKLYNFVDIED